MKILYILDDDISVNTGVVRKIYSQSYFWEKEGHTVKVVSLRSRTLKSQLSNGSALSTFDNNGSIFYKFFKQYNNIKKLDNYLKDYQPDIVYVRHMKYYLGMIKALKRSGKYIVEINSNDLEESKRNSILVYFYNKLTRSLLLKNASAFVSVSYELKNDNLFRKYNKNILVVGNGYAFEKEILLKKNNNIEIVFIGTPGQTWHGLDKVIMLATHLNKYKFHIIGSSKKDINSLNRFEVLPSNLLIHGYLSQEEAESIIVKCTIGISSLALHRNNMNEATPLKSRQYLSLGLPILIGYKDTDFANKEDFILNIGNYENNVSDNILKIDNFINRVKTIDKKIIIEKSKKVLDYKNKEIRRIKFFEEVLKENNIE